MANDKELKRNASGYIDEPCYKEVTAPPRPGEIWVHAKSGAYMLVLANVNGVCPTLRLLDVDNEGTVTVTAKAQMHVKPYMIGYCFENLLTEYVKSVKGEEMAAVRKGIVRALGLFDEVTQDNSMPEEYKALQGEIDSLKAQLKEAKATVPAIPHGHINALEEKVRTLEEKTGEQHDIIVKLEKKNENMRKNIDQATEDLVSFTDTLEAKDQEIIRLTIYKDMYMDIIGKLVAVRGGAANE